MPVRIFVRHILMVGRAAQIQQATMIMESDS